MFEILAFVGPIVGITAIMVLYRYWVAGIVMMLAARVLYAWFIDLPGVQLGILVYPSDVVSTAIFAAGMLKTLLNFSNRASLSFNSFAIALVVSFALGLAENGKPAGVDFRVMFSFLASALYFSAFKLDPRSIVKISNVWILAACALAMIAWAVWAMDAAGLGFARRWVDADPTGVKYRVLNSTSAYVIGVGLVMYMHKLLYTQSGARFWPLALALGGTVLVLQHRSVWGATAASLLLLILLTRRGRSKLLFYGAIVTLVVIIALPFVTSKLSGVWDSVSLQAERATQFKRGTVGGRLHAWQQVWGEWQNLEFGQQLVGKPFGTSYAGLANIPHNCYLQVMYRTGYIGLLLMLLAYSGTLIRLLLRRQIEHTDETDSALLLFALIVGQMAFFVPYSFTPEQGILMGAAMSFAKKTVAVRRFRNILAQHPEDRGSAADVPKETSRTRAILLS